MNRPRKIRLIYSELRRALGHEFASHQVLRSAARLVEIFEDGAAAPSGHRDQRPKFDELPLDKVFADGGWRILAREPNLLGDVFDDEHQDPTMRHKLKSLGLELAA